YEALLPGRVDDPHDAPFVVVGRHCETGDVILEDARLPADTGPGDLVAVPATGAYAHSMSSRYNGVGRAPVVFVSGGEAREVVRRECVDDLLACEAGLAGAPVWRPGASASAPDASASASDASTFDSGASASDSGGR
ncbi:MAG: hypothetical protein ACRELC_06530, partial [Gemmatimonadota bacterium]